MKIVYGKIVYKYRAFPLPWLPEGNPLTPDVVSIPCQLIVYKRSVLLPVRQSHDAAITCVCVWLKLRTQGSTDVGHVWLKFLLQDITSLTQNCFSTKKILVWQKVGFGQRFTCFRHLSKKMPRISTMTMCIKSHRKKRMILVHSFCSHFGVSYRLGYQSPLVSQPFK